MKAAPATPGRPPRVAGWSDPGFDVVANVVHVVAGLVFPPNRQPSAEAGMRRAMTALHIADPLALARAVERPGEARDSVLAELTIGETYFFREAGQLEVIRTHVLPARKAATDAGRPLRLWSAGCASGEEPHTLAILLRELGWAGPAQILGTDVAMPRLDAARRGRYTRWSLRGVSPERVDRWFTRRASHFQLADEIRAAVEFLPLNLVADDYPSAATRTQDQDVVFCRNVLIYFDMETVQRIATRLIASLAPDGWLVCGASDPPLGGLVPCEVVMTPSGMAYRRADRPRGAHEEAGEAEGRPAAPRQPWNVPAAARAEPAGANAPAEPPSARLAPAATAAGAADAADRPPARGGAPPNTTIPLAPHRTSTTRPRLVPIPRSPRPRRRRRPAHPTLAPPPTPPPTTRAPSSWPPSPSSPTAPPPRPGCGTCGPSPTRAACARPTSSARAPSTSTASPPSSTTFMPCSSARPACTTKRSRRHDALSSSTATTSWPISSSPSPSPNWAATSGRSRRSRTPSPAWPQ